MKTVTDCLKDGNFYASAFFSEQLAEKALKGFLYSKGFRAIITHSVLKLLEKSSEYEKGFQQFLDYERELDGIY